MILGHSMTVPKIRSFHDCELPTTITFLPPAFYLLHCSIAHDLSYCPQDSGARKSSSMISMKPVQQWYLDLLSHSEGMFIVAAT